MAIQKDNLRAVEHDWFATRSGLSANAPLTEHKAKYFSDRGFGSNASVRRTVLDMEMRWLSNLTGVTGNSYKPADMWREVVAKAGLTASVNKEENRRKFYENVTGNP